MGQLIIQILQLLVTTQTRLSFKSKDEENKFVLDSLVFDSWSTLTM